MSSRSSPRRVALLVHTASDWTRLLLKGVSSYIREAPEPWNVFLEPRGFHEKLSLPRKVELDGVILRLTHPDLGEAIQSHQIPAVNVSWLGKHTSEIPKVASDERGCASTGIGHLRDRGYEQIAFLGPPPKSGYSDTVLRECQRLVGSELVEFYLGESAARAKKFAKWLQEVPQASRYPGLEYDDVQASFGCVYGLENPCSARRGNRLH